MSTEVVLLSAITGLFSAALIWSVAKNQAAKRALFDPLACSNGHVFGAASWLPLLGFGAARACPTCREPQKVVRVLFEIGVAGYFGLAATRLENTVDLIAVLAFSIPLLVILLVDSWTRLIHMNVIGLGVLLGLIFALLDGPGELAFSAIAMVVAAVVFGGIFFLAVAIYRNVKVVPFGLGDVYLAAMIGAMVRLDDVARALLYGIFLAGFFVAAMLALRVVDRKQAVPYGPYLVLGALIVLVL